MIAMTPELLWSLMFSFQCQTTEVVYYEKNTTEITSHCVSTEVTRYVLSQEVTKFTYAAKKPTPKKVTKKKPRKKKVRRKRRSS